MSPMLSSHEGGGAWPGGLCGPLAGIGRNQFGDGQYSQNIIQGGSVLWPDASGVITITGAATVAPDGETGASVVACDTLVINGAGASLAPSTNSKGLIIFAKTSITLLNGAKLNIDKLGKAGNFGNLTAYDLAPANLKSKLKKSALDSYVVQGEGAAGAAGIPASGGLSAGNTGSAATAMQTGGGGSGARCNNSNVISVGAGGKGGTCCGGAGSGGAAGTVGNTISSTAAGSYGGAGSDGSTNEGATYATGGGAGDPKGKTYYSVTTEDVTNAPTGAGGGLLMLFSPSISVASGCIVSADGGVGGGAPGGTAGGSAGGGCVCVVTNTGGYANGGTVRAAGGASKSATYGSGGAGGAGSVNIFSV